MHVETECQKVLYSKHFVTSQKCPFHVTFDLDLDLKHTLDAGLCGDHRVQVWWQLSHVCGRRSDFREIRKVSISRDLDLDLEHTLDVGPRVDHRVQVWWRSSHVCGRSSDLRVKVYRRTDRQTVDGRLAIASQNLVETSSFYAASPRTCPI